MVLPVISVSLLYLTDRPFVEMRKNNDAIGMIFGKTVRELSEDCCYDWNEL